MKIFLTGATGFIGSHFVNHAHDAGHEIVAQRRSPSSIPRVKLLKQPSWVDSTLDCVPKAALEQCDLVVHLAAHGVTSSESLESCLRWNVLAPLSLFRTAIAAGIDRFVVAGSYFEYGQAGERYDFVPVDAPLEPTQPYSASKATASIVFRQLAIEKGLRLSIHRIFQVYGEGEAETRFWPSLKNAALKGEDFEMTSGEQIRDFIDVSQVSDALLRAADRNDIVPGQPLVENVGSGSARTLRSFAEECWHNWSAKGRLIFGAKSYRQGESMRCVPRMNRSVT